MGELGGSTGLGLGSLCSALLSDPWQRGQTGPPEAISGMQLRLRVEKQLCLQVKSKNSEAR